MLYVFVFMVTMVVATSMAMATDGTFKSQHDYHEREWSEMSLKKRHNEEKHINEKLKRRRKKTMSFVNNKLRLWIRNNIAGSEIDALFSKSRSSIPF